MTWPVGVYILRFYFSPLHKHIITVLILYECECERVCENAMEGDSCTLLFATFLHAYMRRKQIFWHEVEKLPQTGPQ